MDEADAKLLEMLEGERRERREQHLAMSKLIREEEQADRFRRRYLPQPMPIVNRHQRRAAAARKSA